MNLFVWDFHGVLEKDCELAVMEVTNKVLEKFSVKKRMSLEEIKKFYGLKWSDYFRYCCPNADDKTIMEMVNYALKPSLNEKSVLKYIKPQNNVFFVLEKIKEKGHLNLVISNSSQKALKFFIDSIKISDLIDDYIGVDSHTDFLSKSNGKINLLKKYIEKNKFNKIIKIGDNEADIEAGINSGAITYLFSKNKNINTKANYVISDLKEVLKEI